MGYHSPLYMSYMGSAAWGRRRARVLGRHPVCQRCRAVKATQVHHVTYVRLGREADGDLRALCAACHRVEDGVRARATAARRALRTRVAFRAGRRA